MAQAIPIIVLAVSAAGAAYSVHAANEQADAAEKVSDYNQKVAENSALQAQQQAALEAEKVRRRNAALAGRQRAVFGKNGVLISGSAEDILYDSALQGELDRMTAIYSGQVQSSFYQSQGTLAKMQGQAAVSAARNSAVGSVLSGAGSAAGAYSRIPQGTKSYGGSDPQFGED